MRNLVIAIIIFMTFSCGVIKSTWSDIGKDGTMINDYNEVVCLEDFNRICIKDTVSTDLKDWLELCFYNNKNEIVRQWIYIKESDTNKVYVATQQNDSIRLNIRKVIE